MPKEADIHFELYRHLQNAVEKKAKYHGLEYGKVIPEKEVDSGRADIVIEDARGRAVLVIEAKREVRERYHRDLDPYSPHVIGQAFNYAGRLGAEYFATYNGGYLVLFRTFEEGVPLLKRKSRAYRVRNTKVFAGELLEQLAAIEKGRLGWEPDPQAFVNRLRVFHQRLADELLSQLDSLGDEFFQTFNEWTAKQGWDGDSQEQRSRFARQAAYLLMNKLLFYKVLEDTGHDVPTIDSEALVDPEKRRESFKRITDRVDFEAIYAHDPLFDRIPLSERATLETQEFLEELERYDLDRFQYDTIGHIYEDIIPIKERHDLGQYYTPPEVVELITRMTILDPDALVLDPACGSGSFLVRAYNRLRELKHQPGREYGHKETISQLFGIDINRFPAHLSAINLALQNLKEQTKDVNIIVADFFDIAHGQDRLFTETVSLSKPVDSPLYVSVQPTRSYVDAVVANPPYIRQEKIDDKEKCRNHLVELGYADMSERSDIYVYFFTHSTQFLKEGGRMGYITSEKWLTAGYGSDLQKFFLDNYKILAIVSFSRRVFTDPLVPTCVTILEKSNSSEERNSHVATFLRVRKPIDIDELIEILNTSRPPGTIEEQESYRLIALTQSELATASKWNRFLTAPTLYWDLLGHERICAMKDVAEVTRGITTGANDFFYLKVDELGSWPITEQFVSPLVKSIKQADRLEFRHSDTDFVILDLSDYVEQVLSEAKDEIQTDIHLQNLPSVALPDELTPEEIYVLDRMYQDGHKGLYRYIITSMWEKDWERGGPPQRRATCLQYRSRNKCWFNLGDLKKPELFAAKGYWDDMLVPLNRDRLVIDCRLYQIHSEYGLVLAGILNSSLTRFFREIHARITGGGMSEMMVYEMERMPILNPRTLSETEAERIAESISDIIKDGETRSTDLDKAVLAPLGLEERVSEFNDLVNGISEARRQGKDVSLMLDGVEGAERVTTLRGADVIDRSNQTRLTDF